MLPAKKTRRKFYNKYLYKSTLRLPGISIIRFTGTKSHVVDLYLSTVDVDELTYRKSTTSDALNYHQEIVSILRYIELAGKGNIHTRIEGDCIDLYTSDKTHYDFINSNFEDNLRQRFEPDDLTLDLVRDQNVMICSKLPKNRYNYRVYLRPHVLAKDSEAKLRFLQFLEGLNGHVSITAAVKLWFIKTDWNWDRRYILVEDEATLLMLKLRNSDVIGKVVRFVIPINTACPQKA